jgi:hypothetical protein
MTRLERPGFRTELLCLFTTLTDAAQHPVDELIHLYNLRWHIELNLRYLKTQMSMVQLSAKSADMARKEWLSGMLAYNLTRAAMLCAALHKEIWPLSLSFTSSKRRLFSRLSKWVGQSPGNDALGWLEKTLLSIANCRLPRRKKPRPIEPRAQRHLRHPYPPLLGSRADAREKLRHSATNS